ncbi:MAG: GAF domain-containing sensor histidine kinase [Candidatus Promineifilaceae bacterium]|nr:GAF domain-containing sensor histidine kinase [Candidatus Promineifilaceae bacterium]
MSINKSLSPRRRFAKWPGRAAWTFVAIPIVGLTSAGIPYRYTQLLLQNQWFFSEQGLQTRPALAALIVLLLELLVGLIFFLSGAFFAWFKSDDRIGFLIAFAFLAQAATFPGMTDALIDETMTTRWLSWSWFIFSLRALAAALSILLFYMLPDGRLRPKWTRILAPIWLILCLIWLLLPQAPFSVVYGDTFRATETASILFVTAWWLSGITALFMRFRRAAGVERQQIKWIFFGLFLAGLGSISYLLIRPLHSLFGFSSDVYVLGRPLIASILYACLPVCITVAIFRYRLWQLNHIINRTLVYGTLTALTMAIYVLMVGGLGSLLQLQSRGLLAFLATGVVAVLFQPLRQRLQTAVDRFMYGRRADPVALLTELAHHLETVDAPQGILPTLVEDIATSLKLPYVALEEPGPHGGWQIVACTGQLQEEFHILPLLYQNQAIGRLLVAPRSPGEPFSPLDERLLATIAQLSATTVQAARLSAEVRDSRRDIVTSREEERRRLRRDLHDGLGPLLAAITIQADTARDLVESEPAQTREILDNIMDQAQTAVTDVRRLVYDLRPPTLDELGLVGALRRSAQAYRHQLQVTVHAPEQTTPLPAAVEVAALRITQEALNNVVRHAGAAHCTVTLTMDGELRLVIEDDGVGLPLDPVQGVGLISMQERAAELGGSCIVRPLSAGGTQVIARLPLL